MSQHEIPDVPVWAAVLEELSGDERVTPQLQGFINLAVAQGVMSGTLYLDVPNDLTAAQLNKRLRAPIMEALARVDAEPAASSFRVVVNPELADAHLTVPVPVQSASAPVPIARPAAEDYAETAASPSRNDTRLNPKYSFDNFVIGQSNRFAHAAAVAVAEAPAKAYNPLFIYGDSGLGKTHLLHAIGDYALSLYTGIRVRYVSSEEFTNDFINSIANNRGSAFQARYRDVDILLIDDIQFLQGKAETQEAFFHTFNTLHDHDKQVVITSDVPPRHLTGFEDRMRSRFEWGLITDVQAPDLETRIAILRKKAQSERLLVPDEVLEYIATKVSSNIRELEGALIRVSAFASLNRSTLDISLAQTVLRDIVDTDDANVISPTDIITATAQYFRLSVDDLYGSSRSQSIATARQIAMYLCRERTSLSLPKIGQLFGNRDHTTVMYAYKKISELMKERRSIYNQVSEITTQLGRVGR
ncbi:MAG: chromosomal replication initiation protein DnaA [Microbacterium sp. 69-7]|uniref:Chromosomal replication initiator protein DnaA n=1 Tax=Microbacterium laevaniformans TaxID=36807 RepID=A0A150HCW1_9MICO|nr:MULTISPECIES: chromosomal replication initiator protein DnaA [Microbacterium]EXJ51395.1 chromosomal replication initiation protein [Microbacterium sp. MRS-1]KXZ59967.1 Chromosomal replication initiator protein DnaA [Microbacterium laevaniformans]ODT24839.1 MAG: chromosomal replication initiation protein DnaA [Microbacterium sp. SCN 69-37]OJU47610.1 MAG: chromosomal replication initiation protein DnaA [Microbacterium sp. 69-7]RKS90229.1 chromosomal replication initiator protein DnaA [Microba